MVAAAHLENGEIRNYDKLVYPLDEDHLERKEMPFEVRQCYSPMLLKLERPITEYHATVADGSGFFARLVTGGNFGCNGYEIEGMQIREQRMEIIVRSCARCGQTHKVHFEKFAQNPIIAYGDIMTHWGMCPNINEPILMRIINDENPSPSQTKAA